MTRGAPHVPSVVADVPPPLWQLTRASCADDGRRCGGGDSACRTKAIDEGFTVQVGIYQMCRPENLRTEPTISGLIGIGGFAIVVGLGIAIAIKRRRGRKS